MAGLSAVVRGVRVPKRKTRALFMAKMCVGGAMMVPLPRGPCGWLSRDARALGRADVLRKMMVWPCVLVGPGAHRSAGDSARWGWL